MTVLDVTSSGERAGLEAPGRHADHDGCNSSGPAGPEELQAGFAAFYLKCYRRVLVRAYLLTRDWAEAEDTAQDAFAAAYKHWESVRSYDRPEAWVLKVLARQIARARRTPAGGGAEILTGDLPDRVAAEDTARGAISKVELNQVLNLIAGMPEQRRRVLTLRYLMDWSTAEIAASLNVSDATVRAHIHAGRRQIGSSLGELSLNGNPATTGESRSS